MDKEKAVKIKALEKFMEAIAQILGCLPSYSDPHPEKGNAHIIKQLCQLTNQSSGSDQCRTIAVTLQENGIVRGINGHIIGRLATMDGLDFNAISKIG